MCYNFFTNNARKHTMIKALPYLAAAAIALVLSAGGVLDDLDAEAAAAADLRDAQAAAVQQVEELRIEQVLHNYAKLAGSKQ